MASAAKVMPADYLKARFFLPILEVTSPSLDFRHKFLAILSSYFILLVQSSLSIIKRTLAGSLARTMDCAHCKKPATAACGRCKLAPVLPGDAEVAYYCSGECQKANWSKHKATCLRMKDRTTLYRVAELAQQLFYVMREMTWMKNKLFVESIQRDGKNVNMYGQYGDVSPHPVSHLPSLGFGGRETCKRCFEQEANSRFLQEVKGNGFELSIFPYFHFEARGEVEALLSFDACGTAVFWMTEFQMAMLDRSYYQTLHLSQPRTYASAKTSS